MEFRKLSEDEQKKIQMALELTGCTCTGASYVEASNTYYIGFSPSHQATPFVRRSLKDALNASKIVLNGTV